MLRRALLTVLLLSYLTCVLFLSGLQGNDSDDNALRKLHGRNENIHGANNEKLEKEFLLNSSRIANMEQMKIIKAPPRTSTVELSTKEICRNPNKNENDLKRARGRRTAASEEDVEEAATSIENDSTKNNSNNENNINNISRTKHRYKNIQSDKSTKLIRYTKEEPNLKKVITFWQKLVSRKRDTITEKASTTSTKVTKKYKTTQMIRISNNTTPKEHQAKIKDKTTLAVNNVTNTENSMLGNEYLRNILNEYASKEEIPSQGSTTDKTNVNTSLDDDTDIFDYLLHRHDTEDSETHKFNARMSKYSYEFKFTKLKCPIEKLKREKENQKSNQRVRELSAMFIRDFQDLETNILSKDKKTTLRYPISSEEDYDEYNTVKKIDRNISDKRKHTESGINNDKLSSTTLPPEMIKQIAENVKNLIIKDLHTDVITSTKGSTKATTTNDMASNRNNIVIEKIMEILRQYKTDNHIDAAHATETIETTVHSTLKLRDSPKIHSVQERKETNSTHYANYPYIFPSHKKIPARTKLENLKRQQLLIPKRHLPPLNYPYISKDFKSRPITFQTNLIEIPPLGVPVSEPVLPLSHNIIITTSPPYFQQLQMFPNRQDRLFKSHLTSNKFNTVQKNNIIKHSNIDNNERGSNKKKPTEYRTRNNDSDDNTDDEGLKRNTYKKNKKPFEHRTRNNGGDDNTEEGGLRQNTYKKNTARYKNGPKFHEKLENYQQSNVELEATSGEDCCKDEIFTREQRPIKHTKKENVSFKKLLKTQQRVTEMLERMLAKSKAEQPISVETT